MLNETMDSAIDDPEDMEEEIQSEVDKVNKEKNICLFNIFFSLSLNETYDEILFKLL